MKRWPLLLLGLGVTRHYVWPLLPLHLQSAAWQIGAAVSAAALVSLATMISIAWLHAPVRTTLAVGLWWLVEEIIVVGCELAYLFNSFVPTGDERCTAQTGAKIGSFGLVAVALLLNAATRQPARNDSSASGKGRDNG